VTQTGIVVAEEAALAEIEQPVVRRSATRTIVRALRLRRTQVGLALLLLLVGIALIGPLFSPASPSAFTGLPSAAHSSASAFGTDKLGRDVLARFLWGGRSVFALTTLATGLGLVLGIAVGLIAAYARNRLDDLLMRTMDVILSFPQIILSLVAVATVGPKIWLIILTVGITTMPRVARVVRGAALEIVERDFVRAAEAFGESRPRILLGEVLPNIASPLLVEASLRYTYTVALIAALSFLGFGLQPPRADWGLMINENRLGILTAPWGVALPVLAIGLLTIATGLIGDGLSRAVAGLDRGKEAA
jgi:peptide/nickel transport system permease protein